MESVFNSINDCLMILNLENEILFCNESLLKRLKYTNEELKNKNILEITLGKNTFNGENQIILLAKDNNTIKFEYKLINNKFENNNSIYLILIEKEEVYKEKTLQWVLDKIPIMACIKDISGKYIYANETGLKVLNCRLEDIIGKTASDFWNGEDLENILNDDRNLISNKNRIIKEDQVWLDGRLRWFKVAKNIIWDNNGEAQYIFGTAEEITEEKENKEMREILEREIESEILRNEFFNNISHEFKTPLNLVLSTTQLLNSYIDNNCLNKIDEKKLKDYISIINNNSYRLLRLVNNLIDMTEIDTGYYEPILENHDIIPVIENMVHCVSEYVEKVGGTITFDTVEEERVMACDIEKIERIILNLLSNSIKYTEKNINIFVSVTSCDDNISISIKDNGIGITDDKINTIFNSFFQCDKSLSRKQEGSGVGLALVKSLVEMHGGTIEVDSKPGVGSEFIVNLPVRLVESNKENIVERKKVCNKEKCKIEFSDIYFI